METTILEQLGGRGAVELVVADFYGRVLADTRLLHFFRGVQMSRLQTLQVDFFCSVLGGAAEDGTYRGRDMVRAHEHLDIRDEHFDAVAGHLVASLAAAQVPPALIERIIGLVGTLRPHVVRPGISPASPPARPA